MDHGVQIRLARPEDGAAINRLFERIVAETDFMLMEPGESTVTDEQGVAQIQDFNATRSGVVMVAEIDGQLAGVAFGRRAASRRQRHTLYLVLAVRKTYWGQGLGRGLTEAIEAWARAAGIGRLELTVQARNERAVRLYERLGFAREGIKRRSLRIGGRYQDELYMAKLIDT